MAKFTVKEIEALDCGAEPRKVAVGEDGLYLLVRRNQKHPGRFDKYWRYDYKFDGKAGTASYGVFPRVTLVKAKEEHLEFKRTLRSGTDPREQRRREKVARQAAADNTLKSVAEAWLKTRGTWAESHRKKVVLRLENDIYPTLGSRPISKITAADLFDALSVVQMRGATDSAHRIRSVLSQIYRYAIVRNLAQDNPAEHLKGQLNTYKKKSYPHITDPKRLGELMRAIYGHDSDPVISAAMKLSPLVMLRPGELRGALWGEIDLDTAVWRIPAGRMKRKDGNHIIPLSRQAVSVLREVEPHRDGEGRVFPSRRSQDRMISNNTLNTTLRSMGFSKDEHCMHGWRHTASTVLNEWKAFDPDLIEVQLHHGDPTMRGKYNKASYFDLRREMLQQWADFLDDLRDDVSQNLRESTG